MPKHKLFRQATNRHTEQARENGKFTVQGEAASTKLTINVTPSLRKEIEALANSQGATLANWVRGLLLTELAKAKRKGKRLAKTIDNTEPARDNETKAEGIEPART